MEPEPLPGAQPVEPCCRDGPAEVGYTEAAEVRGLRGYQIER